jgi:hypothetical protein
MSDPLAAQQPAKPAYDWDFFLAHAGDDLSVAQNLYVKLDPPAKVFLDAVSMLPGDDWDVTLSEAQRSSLISVILVSTTTEKAYYQREEIAAAIDMARNDPRTHRVVPVYLNAKQIPGDQIPYGLKLKHSLYVPESGDMTETGQQLLKTLGVMKQYEEKKTQVVTNQRVALEKLVNGRSGTEVLAGFNEVTKFVRPLLYTLIVLLVLMIGVLVISILIPSDVRGLLAAISGSLAALLLLSILWLSARSLKFAPLIAEGRINGG